MNLDVCIQDPSNRETTYLYEAILAAAKQARNWRGLYAFASRDGVDHLIEDQIVLDLLGRDGEVDLIVGVDAVTNRTTLERMQELEECHDNFRPRVFWNQTRGLFHPKISDFELTNGGRIVIVGSGNLTPGGLMRNFEAYTVISAGHGDEIDFDALEEFLERHANDIRRIDEEVLERAAANIIRPLSGIRRGGAHIRRPPARDRSGAVATQEAAEFGRILLAQVPRAGGRWSQVHFNAQVINEYFRLNQSQLDTQRVYLTRVSVDATTNEVEVRPCVFSADSNRNYKIEIGAAKHRQYPDPSDGPPILIFKERQLRTYDYILLLPGENGYDSILKLSNRLPSPGKGFARPITNTNTLANEWPDCPLLHVQETDSDEM